MQRLSTLRGSPVVLLFQSPEWDPAERELVDTYNRLVSGLKLPGAASATLMRVSSDGEQRSLLFSDASLSLPVIDGDASLLAELGLTDRPRVVVIDAEGRARWTHSGDGPADTAELARAVTDAAMPTRGGGAWSRRQFVATVFGVACAITLRPTFARAERAASAIGGPGDPRTVILNVNGRDLTLHLEPRVTLLDALREYATLTGTKKGCDHGQCGACTVHIDDKRQLACLTFAVMQQNKRIVTIEGLARGETLHPMQQAFISHDGFQCGYCTPGQIMSATAMLDEPWGAGDADVREAMSGNICRCGAYVGIVAAIQDVRAGRRATQ